jgi:hypothetical protein
MRNQRAIRVVRVFALSLIVLLWLPATPSTAGTVSQGPTLSQLISYVDASSNLKQGPNVLTSTPTLTQAANDDTATMIPGPCIAFTPAIKALPTTAGTTCAFGDKTATKTLLLFGDSQASMWLPAFNIAGQLLKWKVVFLAKDGCAPWVSPVTKDQGSLACSDWERGEIAVANKLKPQAVVPIGLTLAELSDNQYPSTIQFVGELQSMVKALAPSGAKILLMQEIPQFYPYFTSATPEACLTIHTSSIQSCELTIKQVKAIETTVGLSDVASIDHLATLPIRELFCGKKRCDVFVDSPGESHLIYQDWAHMNATYSTWIGPALSQLLAKYLPA